jgi:hypothetical protein
MHYRRRFLRGCGSVAVESGLGGGETLRNVQLSDESTRRLVDRMVTGRAVDYISKNARSDRPFFLYVRTTQW